MFVSNPYIQAFKRYLSLNKTKKTPIIFFKPSKYIINERLTNLFKSQKKTAKAVFSVILRLF
jgi:hypothetical protein